MILSTLDNAGLTEHGSSINGSWLTPKGAWFLNAARAIPFDDIDEAGLPHNGDACTEQCWAKSRTA